MQSYQLISFLDCSYIGVTPIFQRVASHNIHDMEISQPESHICCVFIHTIEIVWCACPSLFLPMTGPQYDRVVYRIFWLGGVRKFLSVSSRQRLQNVLSTAPHISTCIRDVLLSIRRGCSLPDLDENKSLEFSRRTYIQGSGSRHIGGTSDKWL